MSASEITPTQSAYQELKEESRAMQEGYSFLDEKRLILAAEIISELERYEQLRAEFEAAYRAAKSSLRAALERHGLDGLEVYTGGKSVVDDIRLISRSVLGLTVHDVEISAREAQPEAALNASPEGDYCRELFTKLIPKASKMAGMVGNLERLQKEYKRVSRRARALEDVLLPELDQSLIQLDAALEELDREEATRVRWAARTSELK